MQIIDRISALEPLRGCYLSIGNFDGVHAGHQSMISLLVSRARAHKVPAVVMTFEPHPWTFLRASGPPPALTTVFRRAELFGHLDVDYLLAYPTSRELLALSAAEFFQQIVIDQLQATGLVEGPNFFFGKDRGGNTTSLRGFCEQHNLSLDVVPPVTIDGQLVSSSVVRSLITAGDIDHAVRLLGHAYRIDGRVGHGEARGRTIGFPTANLVNPCTLVPGAGVYAARCRVASGLYPAAVNVGPNPTFGEGEFKIEAHLIGFQGDLYDQPLTIDFVKRLRDTRKFAGLKELKQQLATDIAQASQVAQTTGLAGLVH